MGTVESVESIKQECAGCLQIPFYINKLYQTLIQDSSIEDVERAVNSFSIIFEAPPCKLPNLCPRARNAVLNLRTHAIRGGADPPSETQLKGLFLYRALAIIQLRASGLQAPVSTIEGLVAGLNTQPWTIDQGATEAQRDAASYLRLIYEEIETLRKTLGISPTGLHCPPYQWSPHSPEPACSPRPACSPELASSTFEPACFPEPASLTFEPASSTFAPASSTFEPALSTVGSTVMSLVADGDVALSEVAVDIYRLSSQVAAASAAFE